MSALSFNHRKQPNNWPTQNSAVQTEASRQAYPIKQDVASDIDRTKWYGAFATGATAIGVAGVALEQNGIEAQLDSVGGAGAIIFGSFAAFHAIKAHLEQRQVDRLHQDHNELIRQLHQR